MRWFASFLSLWLTILAGQLSVENDIRKLIVTSGTLILIGASTSDITIAADSAVSSLDGGLQTGATKIYPIGKFTACTLNNAAALEVLIGTRIADTADFDGIVKQWAKNNPRASVREANQSLSQAISKELKRFFVAHHDIIPAAEHVTVSLVCLGYDLGSPIEFSNDFHDSIQINNFEPSITHSNWRLPPGFFVPLGESKVCLDILHGGSPLLHKYTQVSAVKKYRKLQALGKSGQFSTDDLLKLSETWLKATESHEGREFDPNADIVAAPNHFAVISQVNGFRKLATPR